MQRRSWEIDVPTLDKADVEVKNSNQKINLGQLYNSSNSKVTYISYMTMGQLPLCVR